MADPRLRAATSIEISTTLEKLFRALTPKKGSVSDLMESYLIACHKSTKHAIETVAIRIIRGEIEGLSKVFAPSPAELSVALREEMAFVAKQIELDRGRTMLGNNRSVAAKRMNVLERVESERKRMNDESRALLMRFQSFDAFNQWVRRNRLPVGSFYLAPTAELYGGPGSGFDMPAGKPVDEVRVVQENDHTQHDISSDAVRARLDALEND